MLFQGSVAIAGAAVKWLRDNIGIIENSADIGKNSVGFNLVSICWCFKNRNTHNFHISEISTWAVSEVFQC